MIIGDLLEDHRIVSNGRWNLQVANCCYFQLFGLFELLIIVRCALYLK
jgi:hypothetical protein